MGRARLHAARRCDRARRDERRAASTGAREVHVQPRSATPLSAARRQIALRRSGRRQPRAWSRSPRATTTRRRVSRRTSSPNTQPPCRRHSMSGPTRARGPTSRVFSRICETVIDLKRRYVAFFPPADHPYDVMLDDYEPGMKTADVRRLFDALRPRQVAIIKRGRQPSGAAGRLHESAVRRRRPLELCGGCHHRVRLRLARAAGRTSQFIRSPPGSAPETCASRPAGSRVSRCHCCSAPCTKPGMRCTSRASAWRITVRSSKAAPHSASTSRRAGCGRTSSADPVASGIISSRSSRSACPAQLARRHG